MIKFAKRMIWEYTWNAEYENSIKMAKKLLERRVQKFNQN